MICLRFEIRGTNLWWLWQSRHSSWRDRLRYLFRSRHYRYFIWRNTAWIWTFRRWAFRPSKRKLDPARMISTIMFSATTINTCWLYSDLSYRLFSHWNFVFLFLKMLICEEFTPKKSEHEYYLMVKIIYLVIKESNHTFLRIEDATRSISANAAFFSSSKRILSSLFPDMNESMVDRTSDLTF